jgi:hypothetical protein
VQDFFGVAREFLQRPDRNVANQTQSSAKYERMLS